METLNPLTSAHAKVLRYGELKRSVTGITHKMLSMQLKELELDGLIQRKEYRQIPPRVDYSLTPLGSTLQPMIAQMYDWGKENMTRDALGFETSAEDAKTFTFF
jgi:DNA-binding HxlR family transcriptional regulator